MKTATIEVEICPHPVFIIGSPRSGTSILAWALHQHSHFWTSRESDLLHNLFGGGQVESAFRRAYARPEGAWLQEQKVTEDEFFHYLGIGLNALFTSRSEGKRWVDQTPLNTLMLNILADMFPRSYFIHILRDSRRVVHSMMNFNRIMDGEMRENMEKAGVLPSWSTDFKNGCDTWRFFVERSLDFCAIYPDRCLTVTNELLSNSPKEGFQKIFGYLQAPYEDGPAEYMKNNRINSSFKGTQEGAPGPRTSKPWVEWPSDKKQIYFDSIWPTLVRYNLASEADRENHLD